MLMFSDSVQSFIAGLAAYRIFRATGDQVWADRGRTLKKMMGHWAEEGSSWNFSHKHLLLQAEEHYCLGDHERARESYSAALAEAKQHKFVNDLSLGYELTAMFLLEIGDLQSALEHFTSAHEAYSEWGAM